MAKVTVDTKALDRVIANLKRVGAILPGGSSGLPPVMKKALDNVGAKILKAVHDETPVSDDTRPDYHENSQFQKDKTHLKDSWKWRLKVNGAIVEGYAHVTKGTLDDLIDLLEAGSPSHSITAKPGSVLRFYVRSGGSWEVAYTKVVLDHPGFQANKFTQRAQHKANVYVKELVSVMQSEINSIISGK
jgi:hypothetical protein